MFNSLAQLERIKVFVINDCVIERNSSKEVELLRILTIMRFTDL